MKLKFLSLVTLGLIGLSSSAFAQGACGRALMMAGPDINGPAEVAQKRMLERECEAERADDRARQQLAQKRIEARSSWNAVRPEIKACINAKLEIDGRTIDQLINLGISASDEGIAPYRRECFGLPAQRDGANTPAPSFTPPSAAAAQSAGSTNADRNAPSQSGSTLLSPTGRDSGLVDMPGQSDGGRVVIAPGNNTIVVVPGGRGGAQGTRNLSLLEAAVNPLSGSRRLWESFKDEGGLASFSDFHGVKINKVSVNVERDQVASSRLQVPAATPPRKVREALNDACRGREQDWKTATDSRGTRGELITPQLICRYETDDGASDYEVVMQRRK